MEQYNKALEVNKEDYKPYQYISEAYKGMGNEDKAIEFAQAYMDKNPNVSPSDYVKMAEIYNAKAQKGGDQKEANVDKAINVYNSFAEKYPQLKAYAHLQAANIAFQNELDDKALANYELVIKELESKQYDEDEKGYLMQAYKNAGYIYWSSKKDLTTAQPYFEKLIKLDPNNSLAKKALGLDEEQQAPVSYTHLKQIETFKSEGTFGVSMSDMSTYLSMNAAKRPQYLQTKGIPLDSIKGGMSEFQQWVDAARNANEEIKIALKADASTPYKTVKRVMNELQDMDESHYYMITQLKQQGDE